MLPILGKWKISFRNSLVDITQRFYRFQQSDFRNNFENKIEQFSRHTLFFTTLEPPPNSQNRRMYIHEYFSIFKRMRKNFFYNCYYLFCFVFFFVADHTVLRNTLLEVHSHANYYGKRYARRESYFYNAVYFVRPKHKKTRRKRIVTSFASSVGVHVQRRNLL